MAVVAGAMEAWDRARRGDYARIPAQPRCAGRGSPLRSRGIAAWLASPELPFWAQVVLTLALVTALGPLLYRIAYQPLAEAGVLVLLIVSVAVHLALTGLGLVVLRRRGIAHAAILVGDLRGGRHHHQRPEHARGRHQRRADRRALSLLRTHALRQGAAGDRAQSRRRPPLRRLHPTSRARLHSRWAR